MVHVAGGCFAHNSTTKLLLLSIEISSGILYVMFGGCSIYCTHAIIQSVMNHFVVI